ncbi:YhjD/YihY/BrkB family envelope integrity protein [Marinoscillum sp. MHG1-6]|uniref:YhjD/YihY/BrkB family envelope integrity protein n=1 Tax=Marinoscillum sp. MHG1-6 TaxID=2959627 RepID=UPI00215863D1|nr:YhjD/YihY/BrkB family envelope integrity protein [Marinoscillum sp. MHG1-6]
MALKFILSIQTFFKETVWNTPLNTLPKWEAFLYRQVRIWMITFSEYQKDKCGEKASALTYFSLLSIVPVLAIAFGIGQMFGLREYIQSELKSYFSEQGEIFGDQEVVLAKVTSWADNMLSGSSGGIISGVSAVLLIYAVARLLNNVEHAFNDVWNTKQGRSLKRKVTDYISVIFLGPIILIISSSTAVLISESIEEITNQWALLEYMKPTILLLIKLIPYTLICFLLFLVYIVFPNTSVKLRPAFTAALFAGAAFQLTQFAWINGQAFLSGYSAIYGSFAAFPLFLIWLQLSWLILLLGAEFAYAIQNVSNWTYSDEGKRLSRRLRKRLLFMVLHKIVKHFSEEDGPLSFQQLTEGLFIPNRFVHEVLNNLERAGLVSRVKTSKDDGNEYYQPSVDVSKLDVHLVLRKLDLVGVLDLNKLEDNPTFKAVDEALIHIESYGKTSEGNKLIKDL